MGKSVCPTASARAEWMFIVGVIYISINEFEYFYMLVEYLDFHYLLVFLVHLSIVLALFSLYCISLSHKNKSNSLQSLAQVSSQCYWYLEVFMFLQSAQI